MARARTILLWILSGLSVIRVRTDPCDGRPEVLGSWEYRGVDFEAEYEFATLCDSNTIKDDVWLRVSDLDNQRLPESCPPELRCGTHNTMWLNTAHPAGDDEVPGEVCMNRFGTCCAEKFPIRIKRCPRSNGTHYFVYDLADPGSCFAAYCVETFDNTGGGGSGDDQATVETTTTTTTTPTITTTTELSCPGGSTPDSGRPGSCISRYPQMAGAPRLEGPYLEDGTAVAFYCNVQHTTFDPLQRERFFVTFVFTDSEDGRTALTEIQANPQDIRIKLDESELVGRIGQTLSCEVQSAWSFSPGVRSPTLASLTDYWLGIQLRGGALTVTVSEADDTPTIIMPASTIPVTCPGPIQRCLINVQLVSTSDDVQYQYACDYFIRRIDWRQSEFSAYSASTNISIRAASSPALRADTTFQLQFATLDFGEEHIWSGYTVDPITITYVDSPYGLCSAVLDTDVTTFDNREFVLQARGQFRLLRSSASRLYEVQIRTQPTLSCPSTVACICAVGVREGDVVLSLDACSENPNEPRRAVVYQYRDELPAGYSVTRNGPGTRYSFNMASGAHVIVDVKTYGLNVYAYVIGEDYDKTSGLCGVYDGNTDNDPSPADKRERDLYRVATGTSFFETAQTPHTSPEERDVVFCTCTDPETDEVTCGRPTDTSADDSNYYGSPGYDDDQSGSEITPSVKDPDQSQNDDTDRNADLDYEFDYGEDFEADDSDLTWPTADGKTESEARTYCQTSVNRKNYHTTCQDTVGVNPSGIVEKCVNTVKRLDSFGAGDNALSSYEQNCVFRASTDPSLGAGSGTQGGSGQTDQSKRAVLNVMCPGECSERGTCTNRQCICDQGYIGADCGTPVNVPPTVYRVIGGEICDVRARPCRHVSILASGVTDVPTLTCRVTLIHQNGDDGETVNTKAELRTLTEVSCELPLSPVQAVLDGQTPAQDPLDFPFHSWRVEISNDGVNYGQSVTLAVWDSKCLQQCTANGSCTRKSNTCLIRGRCFADGEESQESACGRCDPDVSESEFTSVSDNSSPVLQGPFNVAKFPDGVLLSRLSASDPDGQTRFSYRLHRPVTLRGVSVTSDGTLRVEPFVSNVTFDVQVMDSCGSPGVASYRVYTVDCPCASSRTCSSYYGNDADLEDVGGSEYQCQCPVDAGYGQCPSRLETCLSAVCADVSCQDAGGSRDVPCTCSGSSTSVVCSPDTCGEDGAWSECSKECDYGVQTCGMNNRQLCNQFNCEEDPDESGDGVIVVAKVKDAASIQTILVELSDFLDIIRDNINQACTESPEECCQRDIWLNPTLTYNFVPSDYLYNARGYPKADQGRKTITFKLLALIPSFRMSLICEASQRSKRSVRPSESDGRPVPSDILRSAVTRSVEELEQQYGVEITSVETVGPDGLDTLYVIIIAVVVCVVVLVVVIVTSVVCWKKKKAERREAERKLRDKTESQYSGKDRVRSQHPPDHSPYQNQNHYDRTGRPVHDAADGPSPYSTINPGAYENAGVVSQDPKNNVYYEIPHDYVNPAGGDNNNRGMVAAHDDRYDSKYERLGHERQHENPGTGTYAGIYNNLRTTQPE